MDTVRIKQAEQENLGQNAAIYCSGAKSCEFERLNDITVVDAQTRRISNQAIHQGIVSYKVQCLAKLTAYIYQCLLNNMKW